MANAERLGRLWFSATGVLAVAFVVVYAPKVTTFTFVGENWNVFKIVFVKLSRSFFGVLTHAPKCERKGWNRGRSVSPRGA